MAGSTFLTLTNKVLTRLNEIQLTSGTFATVVGFPAVAKQAVNNAIRRVHEHDVQWPWLYTKTTQLLIVGTYDYTLPAATKSVDWDSFYLKPSTTLNIRGIWLPQIQWDQWTQHVRTLDDGDGTTKRAAVPDNVVRGPNSNFLISPTPDQAYTVEYQYWAFPADLALHSDTTLIPSRFDYVVVEAALQDCFLFRSKAESAAIAGGRFDAGLKDMRSNQINSFDYMRSGQIPDGRTSSAYLRIGR